MALALDQPDAVVDTSESSAAWMFAGLKVIVNKIFAMFEKNSSLSVIYFSVEGKAKMSNCPYLLLE